MSDTKKAADIAANASLQEEMDATVRRLSNPHLSFLFHMQWETPQGVSR